MDRDTLRQKLLELLEDETGETYPDLDDTYNLRGNLGLDSVDLITLVMEIQNQFQIHLPTQDLEEVESVGDLLDLVQARTTNASNRAA